MLVLRTTDKQAENSTDLNAQVDLDNVSIVDSRPEGRLKIHISRIRRFMMDLANYLRSMIHLRQIKVCPEN